MSLIRGATNRLENLSRSKKESLIPEDFITDIINIFQTTSVAEFNDLFSYYSRANILNIFITGPSVAKPTIEQILKFVETQYRKFAQSGKWTGVTTKLTETAYVMKSETFNCGGDHHLSPYPLPKNEDRIKANYKLFIQNKKKESSLSTSNSTSEKKRSKFLLLLLQKKPIIIAVVSMEKSIIIFGRRNVGELLRKQEMES